MDCVSLFSGAGGLDLGFKAAGFTTRAAVEIDSDSCRTLKANGFEHVFCVDVRDWLKQNSDLRPDILIGGPPCQPFSKSAYWSSTSAQGLADKRADCLALFFDAVRCLRPKAFLIENVPGFLTADGVGFVKAALQELEREGIVYQFNWKILNCADFGVPQKRQRFFGVGAIDFEFTFPEETHGSGRARTHLGAWDALRKMRKPRNEDVSLKGKWADLIPSIPEGENYLWHTSRGGGQELFGWRTRYWSFLQKLSKAEPAPTIVATPAQDAGPFHWNNRKLSTRELAALQTFPSNYSFLGNQASRRRQIGNAVPPLMSEILARQIGLQLGTVPSSELTYSIAFAGSIPPPNFVHTAPARYDALVQFHKPHPGTGKGPSPRPTKLLRAKLESPNLATP